MTDDGVFAGPRYFGTKLFRNEISQKRNGCVIHKILIVFFFFFLFRFRYIDSPMRNVSLTKFAKS